MTTGLDEDDFGETCDGACPEECDMSKKSPQTEMKLHGTTPTNVSRNKDEVGLNHSAQIEQPVRN